MIEKRCRDEKVYDHLTRGAFVAVLVLVWTASSASAQNYTFDARRIALGGVGGTPNLASKLVERQRRYKSILIPVGLVKVLNNVHVFYPNRDDFDFSRAVEFAYSPFHYVFGRSEDINRQDVLPGHRPRPARPGPQCVSRIRD